MPVRHNAGMVLARDTAMIDHHDKDDATGAEAFDIKAVIKLAEQRHSPLVKAVSSLGKLGDQEPLYLMGFAASFAGVFMGRPGLRSAGLAMVANVAAADLAKQVVKKHVKRTRPERLLEHGLYEAKVGEKKDEKDYNSFPSGHVACTFAAARSIAASFPEARPGGAVATTIIAVARLVKGAHWPMDVLGGLLVGWAASKITSALIERSFSKPEAQVGR
ncbi:MAG: phosphatase PAP2 family protein [Verrucomicrobiaceae bacterium]|nr:MAG: phosphatase PAP2 family protein [Verrucomicrobiaceae bacterium]